MLSAVLTIPVISASYIITAIYRNEGLSG
jgi:hypothetical protein